ncbi:aminotransferase class IV [Solwaraspora sp. WMMD1047]|uniref:aminotransferase class IV n=1 Tax=Solwaraspora sp. WMMD1047 TaxID=3016102 RepID=UPI0024178247|nr:aminotransferase class IV [Solwaraspora sp. WMMD1047]MDG4830792.1 aminotransferase class IV [Solwaraspora sp. WMMD1047]
MHVEVDGEPADAAGLSFAALATYGHLTTLQVRDHTVRGLDRHLRRLDAANRELFDRPLPGEIVRGYLRHALDGVGDAAVRIVVFRPDDATRPRVLVAVGPPTEPARLPQRLRSVAYLRPFAHLKHLGGFGQAHHATLARRAGYDDALLTGPDGLISEGSVANIGFFDGDRVVWPEPPWLHGVTMQLVEDELASRGTPSVRRPIRLRDVTGYHGAFLANSRGVVPVSGIDDLPIPVDDARMAELAAVYAAAPAQQV